MKALKALVIVLGVLIAAGIVLVIYGVSTKFGSKVGGTATGGSFGVVAVPMPEGTELLDIVPVGDTMVARVGGEGGTWLMVLDPVRGRVTGGFRFDPAPPGGATR